MQARQPRVFRRYIRYREALEAANRLQTAPDGRRYVIRFNVGQRIEHLVLIFSFTILSVTGLAQTYYKSPAGDFILLSLGGMGSTQLIHHTVAFIFLLQALYHLVLFINNLFVFHHISKILPNSKDISDLAAMLKLDLGLSKSHPHFDRFNFEEKIMYWSLVWGAILLAISGLMQWFPMQVTVLLPGWTIPVARIVHRWEAILAVLTILTWHLYHTLIKTRNFSIFTGKMTMKQMRAEHPLELTYLEHATAAVKSRSWPVKIEFVIQEPGPKPEP